MKTNPILMLALILMPAMSFAQDAETKDRPFRIAVEPSSFLGRGYSLLATYGINEKRNMHAGIYLLSVDIPDFLNTKMFDSVAVEDNLRMTFELAGVFRYKIPVFKNLESNPYVGLFMGYQTYRNIDAVTSLETNFSNMFVTPQVGYEFYFFRKMLYMDPCFRVAFEFAKETNYSNPLNAADKGPEIKNVVWLPSFAIGIRL